MIDWQNGSKKVHWRAYPFVRLVAVLSIGIVSSGWVTYEQSKLIWPLLSGWVIITTILGYWRIWSLWIGVMSLGLLLGILNDDRLRAHHFSKHWKGKSIARGIVRDRIGKTYILELQSLISSDGAFTKKTCGKVALPDRSLSDSMELSMGQSVLLMGTYGLLPPFNNGGTFNFSQFLQRRKVYHNFIPSQVTVVGNIPMLNQIQEILWNKFKKYIDQEEVNGLLGALVLGNRSLLSNEMKSDYAGAGAMHLLAVSGLHVGMVYLIFGKLLWLFPGSFFQKKSNKYALLTLVIWTYALLTGAAASVRRSATMFSWMALSRWSGERMNIYNAIAGSAFILLCFNPKLLWEVGFQLSYAAVIGIVYFHPYFMKWVKVEHPILKYFWSLLVVGLAAQLSTMPFTLYYFNQFPIYFWLSGCFAVPITGLILIGSILFLIFSIIEPVGNLLAGVLTVLVEVMNNGIAVINDLPGSQIEGIFPNSFQVGCMLFLIFGYGFHLYFKRSISLYVILIALVIWGIGDLWWLWRDTNRMVIKIPYRYQETRLEIHRGGKTYIWGYQPKNQECYQNYDHCFFMPINKKIQFTSQDGTAVSWLEGGVILEKGNRKILISNRSRLRWEFLKSQSIKEVFYTGFFKWNQAQVFFEKCDCAQIACTWLRNVPLVKL